MAEAARGRQDDRRLLSDLAPYVRYADHATRGPWRLGKLRLFDFLLAHIQRGTMIARVEGVEHVIPAGGFCLVGPGDLLELEGTEMVTPYLHLDLFYDPRRETERPVVPSRQDWARFGSLAQPRLGDALGLDLPVRLRPSTPDLFAARFVRCVAAWMDGDAASRLEANGLAAELVATMLRDHVRTLRVAPQARFDWLDSYVTSRISEPISLVELARRARLSRSQFARLFKLHFGTTPHRYVLSLRIRHAQDLLRETALTNDRIAEYCGFADTYHFSKAYKRVTGISPRDYRRGRSLPA